MVKQFHWYIETQNYLDPENNDNNNNKVNKVKYQYKYKQSIYIIVYIINTNTKKRNCLYFVTPNNYLMRSLSNDCCDLPSRV